MTLLRTLLTAIAAGADPGPFALVRRDGASCVEVFTGTVHVAGGLADIPLPPGPAGPRTLALVPYRQVAERGLACVDDGAPLECLAVAGQDRVPLAEALAALPDVPVRAGDGGFDIPDAEYAGIVDRVLRDEIGRGEGANFVIHRAFRATLADPPLPAALAALRRLLTGERGAYWTFLVHTGTRTLVGATPERHVSVEDGLVMMNPISGTFRHPDSPADRAALLRFLADPKEIDELYMVLDEELKMMATVAEHGGQVVGPYLKEMSRLTHTEYLLAGRGSRDVREVLRETMFAPTVTGSPMENACRVIARHERRGRGYYAGVLALLGVDDAGRQTLDAPILIRTAEISPTGELRVPVGATLVRHSTAAGEVAETHTKAAGVLAALGLHPGGGATVGAVPAGHPAPAAPIRLAEDPEVRAALAARNDRLARFWLEQREPGASVLPWLAGRRVLIIDGEDTFTGMLAHQLRAFGLVVRVRSWSDAVDRAVPDPAARIPATLDAAAPDPVALHPAGRAAASLDPTALHPAGRAAASLDPAGFDPTGFDPTGFDPAGFDPAGFDLIVVGPGPGDPDHPTDPKMAVLRGVVDRLLAAGHPTIGICLGHQLLAGRLGLRLHRRNAPYQGLQRDVELFGTLRRVGFYASFTPLADADEVATPYGPVRLARDAADGAVHLLRGATFAGVQFHPESVLSRDGMAVLADLLGWVLPVAAPPAGTAPPDALASGAHTSGQPG